MQRFICMLCIFRSDPPLLINALLTNCSGLLGTAVYNILGEHVIETMTGRTTTATTSADTATHNDRAMGSRILSARTR